MALSVFVFSALLATVAAKEVCYNTVGCFTDDAPFSHLPLPQDPTGKIAPTYYLHRVNSQQGIDVKQLYSGSELGAEAIFIAHGYTESYKSHWVMPMIQKLLLARPSADVVFVDWSRGSMPGTGWSIYYQAASNTRAIAAAIAVLINSNQNIDTSKYHCIGFSLGSQICGFTGKRLNRRWGRISAIEPAAPAFNDKNDPTSRIDKSDADFVDVTHTSMVGQYFAVGHSDFWVNNVKQQPGCGDDTTGFIDSTTQFFTCSHSRGYELYTETIVPEAGCSFNYCPCGSWMLVQMGMCKTCPADKGAQLGYKSILSPNRGEFYGTTTSSAPFCFQA